MNRLYRLRFVILGLVGAGLIVASVFTLQDGGDLNETRGHLGPTPGPASTQSYVEEKRSYLAKMASDDAGAKSAALVSFKSYVPAPAVQKLVRGMEPTAVWVRFPSADPEPLLVETTISAAVAEGAVELRTSLDAEIAELQAQVRTASGAAKSDLTTVVAERKADRAKLGGGCGCVFALSVREATLSSLRELQRESSVKLVDVPDPLTNDLSGWELQPFVPRAG